MLLLATYLVLGIVFALTNAPWQAPDEPAHYNYVAHLARGGGLPTLRPGDWDNAYLNRIRDEGFPPGMPIEPLRYEFHQPPLYYALAAPTFRLTASLPARAQLPLLRLVSVGLGGLLLLGTYGLVARLFPERSWLALGAAGFVGLLPMHLAMTASVNNDVLGELILLGVLAHAVAHLRCGLSARGRVGLGALLGLGLVIKTTTLIAWPLTAGAYLAAEVQPRRSQARSWDRALRGILTSGLTGLGVGGWFLARNALVYGGLDVFGWQRHDTVVAGQPTTRWWIQTYGLDHLLDRFLGFTFRSFWGVFGWLGIFMDERIYRGLGLVSLLALLGLVVFAYRLVTHPYRLNRLQRLALGLFALSALLTAGSYAWYNLKFVQHQGRYLFPSILPIALFFLLGLTEILPRRLEKPASYGLGAGLALLSLYVAARYLP